MVCQRQFWLGPARAGQTVRFWASVDVIHLTIAGARVKSLRSHFSTSDLDQLRRQGATPAGPPPLPLGEDGAAVEVDRAVNNTGLVGLAGKQILAAEILGGRPVIVRVEAQTLMFLDPETRELLRVRPNPLTPSRCCAYRARARPDRHRGPGPNPSPSSGASAPTAGSPSAAKPSRSAACTPGAWSACTSPSTRSRSSSTTTRRARSAAPPPGRSSSSRAAAHNNRAQGQRQPNSLVAPKQTRHDTQIKKNNNNKERQDPYGT